MRGKIIDLVDCEELNEEWLETQLSSMKTRP